MAEKKEKKYVSDNAQLMAEWDWEKNNKLGLYPDKLTCGSNKKVWWICSKGHEWQATIANRSNGNGCPICGYEHGTKTRTRQKILQSGSLQENFPDIANEWDYDKNDFSPSDVLPASNKKAWWICQNKHSYIMKISHRKDGHGCPYCANAKVLTGWNDLETWCKQTGDKTILRWNYEKNKNIVGPTTISKGSKKIVWWKCDVCGYEYKNKIINEVANMYCPKCNKRNKTSFPEQAIFYYLKIAFPDAINGYKNTTQGISELDIYVPSIKLGIEYDGKAWHTGSKSLMKEQSKYLACEMNGIKLIRFKEAPLESKEIIAHEIIYSSYQENIQSFSFELDSFIKRYDMNINVDITRDKMKIYESYLSVLGKRSLKNLFPHIAKEWDYEKNSPLKPNMISAFCNEKFWFICKNNHSYLIEISKRTSRGDSCPICSGHKVLKGFNDLATTHPILCKEWDYEKNTFSPITISKGYDKKVWWICSKCGESFCSSPNSRTSQGTGCAKCKGGISKKVSQYTLNGDFIKCFDSIGQASREMEVSSSLIGRACANHTPACDSQWRYTDTINTSKIEAYEKKLFNNKPVEQYTLDGKYIKTFESVTIAKKETGASKIGDVCNGNRKQSGGYYWRYVQDKKD